MRWRTVLLTTGLLLGLTTGTAGAEGAEIVDSTRHGGRTVAFTFDDGPNPVDTPRLLRVLRQHRVKATFCLWGERVEQHPEVVRAIVADGHKLCNHSWSHDDLGSATPEQVRADLERTSAAINRVVPGVPIRYFRAPYGSWGATPEVAASLGMTPLGWRLAIGDWDPPPSTDELVRRLRDGITEGAVVLMHDGPANRANTVDAVDRIVPELRRAGYRFDRPAR
ncbi:polysaccharide deacetylase family protein [Saccharothrix sp. NPDC042600]|uniref:polysaccharide deacetylase family protein n=1 Tax=Saccharothrix TaxID=2071 RepID=UPI0033FCE9F5|nr:chitooligosaccharide deacetylase NodB [Saccharothrix mutabilis subsp. capreolus]